MRQDIVKEKRAEYGAKIVSALRTQLGWTHFRMIIPMEDELQRDFYAEMCRIERWSTRMLAKKFGGMLYGRTALSKKPNKLIREELAVFALGVPRNHSTGAFLTGWSLAEFDCEDARPEPA